MPALSGFAADLPLATVAMAGAALVALVVWLEARAEGAPRRRLVRGVLRSTVLLCLLGAVVGLSLVVPAARTGTVVLCIDGASRATPPGAATIEGMIHRARAEAKAAGDDVRVFDFRDVPHQDDPPSAPKTPTRSRLAPALAAARMFTNAGPTRVVVATDGRLDLEGAVAAREALEAVGADVRGVLVPPPPLPPTTPTLRIDALDAPVSTRGPFAVRGAVTTNEEADVMLRVDGLEHARVRVSPPGGEVHFDDVVLPPGAHELALHAVARAEPDPGLPPTATSRPAEALRRTRTDVRAPQRVLLVAADADGGPMRRRLAAQGIDADVVLPADAARAVLTSRGDVLVLDADAAATAGPALAAAVADRVEAGAGLVLLAGRDAAAWTAVGAGPLARVLPLSPQAPAAPPPRPPPTPPPPPLPPVPDPVEPLDVPGPGVVAERRPEEALPLTLLVVIDRSGSMSVQNKLSMALAAAEEAAAQLSPTDRVGVITFADDASLDLPPRSVREVAVRSLAVGLVADGNTDIYRALLLALRTLRTEAAPIRHVVLLTDGHDTKSSVYGSLPAEYLAERITLTVVGLGRMIDERSLKALARQAGGSFRYAPTPLDLPRILTRDTSTVLHARKTAAEAARMPAPPRADLPRADLPPVVPPPTVPPATPPRPTPPPLPPPGPDLAPLRRVRPHDAIAGFLPDDLPSVGAPRPGTQGPAAAVLLERGGSPALVAGRAGLGRVLVLAVPGDDAGLGSWRPLPRLLAQAVRSVAGSTAPPDAAEVRVERSRDGDALVVSFPEGADVETVAAGLEVSVDTPSGPASARRVPTGGDGTSDVGRPGDPSEVRFALPVVDASLATVRLSVPGPEGSRRTLPPQSYVPSPPPGPLPVEAAQLADTLGHALVAMDDDALFTPVETSSGNAPRSLPGTRSSLTLALLAIALGLLAFDAWAHRAGRAA